MDTQERTDNRIRNLLENSPALPRAPEGLVNRTVEWMRLIEEGREAERQLKDLEGSGIEKDPEGMQRLSKLAAKAVIGRIATHRNLPAEGYRKDDLETVAGDQRMQEGIRNKSPAAILGDVQNGNLLAKLGTKQIGPNEMQQQKQMQIDQPKAVKQNNKQHTMKM